MDLMAGGQILDEIETPYGRTLMGGVGKIRCEKEDLGSHIHKR